MRDKKAKRMSSSLCTLVSILLFLPHAAVVASTGDASDDFNRCVSVCGFSRMYASGGTHKYYFSSWTTAEWPLDQCKLSLPLRLTQWTCRQDCQYRCMHGHADRHGVIYQYFGKWPFHRIWGCQEPLSTLFSIGNMVQHIRGLRRYAKRTRDLVILHSPSLSPQWTQARFWGLAYGVSSILLWVASTLFHTRDTWITERMDYLGVAFASLVSMQWTLVRLLGHRVHHGCTALVLASLFTRHAYWLLAFDSFSYSYNMAFNLSVGVLLSVIWISWAIHTVCAQYRYKATFGQIHGSFSHLFVRAHHAKLALGMMSGLSLFMLLELLDFPPVLRVLDAHALWHLSTIPLLPVWWLFMTEDAEFWASQLVSEQIRSARIPKGIEINLANIHKSSKYTD